MTVNEDIYRRMSDADKAGFQARSPEGHAATMFELRHAHNSTP